MIFFLYQFSVNLWGTLGKRKKIKILQTLNEQACSACFGNIGSLQPVLDKTGKDSYQCVMTCFISEYAIAEMKSTTLDSNGPKHTQLPKWSDLKILVW